MFGKSMIYGRREGEVRGIGTFVIVGTVLVGLGLLGATLKADALPDHIDLVHSVVADLPDFASDLPRPLLSFALPTYVGMSLDTVDALVAQRLSSRLHPRVASDTSEPALTDGRNISVLEGQHKDLVIQQALRRRTEARGSELADRYADQPANVSAPGSVVGETCIDVLLNPQMDVLQTPEGNYAEPWAVVWPEVYFADTTYGLAPPSLFMADEIDGSDLYWYDATWDYDILCQAFRAPQNLSSMTVMYNRAFIRPNDIDTAWSNIWEVGTGLDWVLEEPIAWRWMEQDPAGWDGRSWSLHPAELDEASGKDLALCFDLLSDARAVGYVPGPDAWFDMAVFLDDAQVRLCYQSGAYRVYLPVVHRAPVGPPGPSCWPRHPDTAIEPGKTMVGATCHGFLAPGDNRDYYKLDLLGSTRVGLGLIQLPPGTNWGASIFEVTGEDAHPSYSLVCYTSAPGDADKWTDCILNPNRRYLVMVDRGEKGAGPYKMRVERR